MTKSAIATLEVGDRFEVTYTVVLITGNGKVLYLTAEGNQSINRFIIEDGVLVSAGPDVTTIKNIKNVNGRRLDD